MLSNSNQESPSLRRAFVRLYARIGLLAVILSCTLERDVCGRVMIELL